VQSAQGGAKGSEAKMATTVENDFGIFFFHEKQFKTHFEMLFSLKKNNSEYSFPKKRIFRNILCLGKEYFKIFFY